MDQSTGPLWRIRLDGDVVLLTESQREDLRKRRGKVGYAVAEPEEEKEGEADTDEVPAAGKKKPIGVLPSTPDASYPTPIGNVVLRAGADRKQAGFYYTNRAFADYLVSRAANAGGGGARARRVGRPGFSAARAPPRCWCSP